MLELFINTASSRTSLYCLQNGKTVFEETWLTTNDEATTILPKINNAFKSNNLRFKDLKKIITVKGPGSFTGVRIGVTIANIMSFATKANLYELDLFTLLEQKNPETTGTIIVKAGKHEIYIKNPENTLETIKIHDFNPNIIGDFRGNVWGDLTKEQENRLKEWLQDYPEKNWIAYKDLKSDLYAIKNITLKKVKSIKPLYIKAPSITKSKKKI